MESEGEKTLGELGSAMKKGPEKHNTNHNKLAIPDVHIMDKLCVIYFMFYDMFYTGFICDTCWPCGTVLYSYSK